MGKERVGGARKRAFEIASTFYARTVAAKKFSFEGGAKIERGQFFFDLI
jgi:hypothetical protein